MYKSENAMILLFRMLKWWRVHHIVRVQVHQNVQQVVVHAELVMRHVNQTANVIVSCAAIKYVLYQKPYILCPCRASNVY